MTKKTFITIADTLRLSRPSGTLLSPIHMEQWETQVTAMADTLGASNPLFKRQRWLDHVYGRCNQNGGKVPQQSR